ncbi:class I SAM-dependent methyltransferase [Weissella viridescens]|uniref:Class I SAM-dependent methyltransferase n=1 Tax=Weissella viridescens TaxID=1629 RepID=A0A3P2RDB6_WEIVI|nr:class I SAM-dependent methyltransferase [Weissella viridescens]RRG18749.1 class I SAM-dependent methyltransferase [Weissella viridescens]
MKNRLKNGLDAPYMTIGYLISGVIVLTFIAFFHNFRGVGWALLWGLMLIAAGLISLHTSLYGKAEIWDWIIADLNIKSDSQVLDLGTGHGLTLIKFADQLGSNGGATGIDLWNSHDQLDNGNKQTEANVKNANLKCFTNILTGDIRSLPFEDNSFDFVTSSFVIHNIKSKEERYKAISEAYRVLKQGGTLVIVDTENKQTEYAEVLNDLGAQVVVKKLGFNGWWSGPWMPSYEIRVKKSA